MVVTANGRPKARARKPGAPKLLVEQGCFDDGAALVCGVDEVGRGAWAGPVTVGAVVIGPEPKRILRVRDSKELTLEQREHLYPKILGWALAAAVGHASPAECDEFGMTAALRLAGERALAGLADAGCVPDRIILDGNHDYFGRPDQVRTVIDGDALCLSVAAASRRATAASTPSVSVGAVASRRAATSAAFGTFGRRRSPFGVRRLRVGSPSTSPRRRSQPKNFLSAAALRAMVGRAIPRVVR